jgi:hypothetical protein
MTSNLSLGITLLATFILVIALFAIYIARSERRWRGRTNGSCPGDSGGYLFGGSDSGGGCEGGSCGGGDGGG